VTVTLGADHGDELLSSFPESVADRWHNPGMFGGRSKTLYFILAFVYGLVCADLVYFLLRGDGNVASGVLAVIFAGATFLCIRSIRRPAPDSQPRLR